MKSDLISINRHHLERWDIVSKEILVKCRFIKSSSPNYSRNTPSSFLPRQSELVKKVQSKNINWNLKYKITNIWKDFVNVPIRWSANPFKTEIYSNNTIGINNDQNWLTNPKNAYWTSMKREKFNKNKKDIMELLGDNNDNFHTIRIKKSKGRFAKLIKSRSFGNIHSSTKDKYCINYNDKVSWKFNETRNQITKIIDKTTRARLDKKGNKTGYANQWVSEKKDKMFGNII